ncbi:putative cytochrome P450 [Helianthus anomalus]
MIWLIETLLSTGYVLSITQCELFAGGTETTGLTTEWFVAELLKNEEAMKKVKDEVTKQINGNVVKESDLVHLPYLEACFKETLRLHPAGPLLIQRKAVETFNVWAINRDPKIWDDPLSFKPERFIGSNVRYKGNEFGYLPFGSGRRMCPGETMASKLILLTVASLVINFDWFIPDNTNPMEINMDEEMDIAMYKKESLHVIFKLNNELFKN